MTFTEAAVEVLRLAGKPLHYKKITEIAIERNLLSHVGKTPEITMASRLATMVKKDRGDAPIIKVKPGVFGLRDFDAEVIQAAEAEPSSEGDLDLADLPDLPEPEGDEAAEAAPKKASRPLPGQEVFPEEDDDDVPILAKLEGGRASGGGGGGGGGGGDNGDPNKRKRRRRRRRGGKGEGENQGSQAEPARPQPGHRGGGPAPARPPREAAVQGDWNREIGHEEVLGKELSDSIAVALGDGHRRPRTMREVADELVRRGRLTGDGALLAPTVAAAVRGDIARREASGRLPRLRTSGDQVSLLEWDLSRDAARFADEASRAADRQADAVRRVFVRRLQELPMAGLLELLAAWLNAVGVVGLRAVRRPGSGAGEVHLAGTLRRGPEETPLAIVVYRDGSQIGRERVMEVRGGLHHYGDARTAWVVTLGQVLSGAREEAASKTAPTCALFDGLGLARAMEEAGIGLRRYALPILGVDLELLEGLTGPGARPAPAPVVVPREASESEELGDDDDESPRAATAAGEERPEGEGRRRRRRRRGRRPDAGAGEAEATGAVAAEAGDDDEDLGAASDDEADDERVLDEALGEAAGLDDTDEDDEDAPLVADLDDDEDEDDEDDDDDDDEDVA